MAKSKLITVTQLKKELKELSKEELITLISELSKSSSQAKEFLSIRFASPESEKEIQEQYKQKIEHEFYPKRGYGRLNLRVAKKAISDFKKVSSNKVLEIDLMLFYVENGVSFTRDYGDINENFYSSMEGMFYDIVEVINSSDEEIYEMFAGRLKRVVEKSIDGWGFQDTLGEYYYMLKWVDEV